MSNSVMTQVHSAVCDVMDTSLMQIESSFTRGFSGMQMIGNTSEVCRDGKERARAALECLGLSLPPRRLLVSLTPGDMKKDGNQFDLPIAVSLALLLTEKTPQITPSRWLFAAELGLAGELRPVKGVVSFALAALSYGLEGIVVAAQNRREVEALTALSRDEAAGHLQLRAFSHLSEVLDWLFEPEVASVASVKTPVIEVAASEKATQNALPNFDDMILHPELALAAMTAAAGMHSLLLRGSPGTGKSMLAMRLASILPPMEPREHIEALKIHSLCAERLPPSLIAGRPVLRAPHHQASAPAVLGSADVPGELSLAHGGVLFLDELPEFRRDLLEALREPLESGEVRVARSRKKGIWKARALLVAAANNCPCGYFGSGRRVCRCSTPRLLAYRERFSGPVLDRIDIHINAPEPEEDSASLFLRLAHAGEISTTRYLAQKVAAARAFAASRNAAFGAIYNSDVTPKNLVALSGLETGEFGNLVSRIVPVGASSRAVLRSLRVARTLADLEGEPAIRAGDLLQAWRWQSEPAAQARGEMLLG